MPHDDPDKVVEEQVSGVGREAGEHLQHSVHLLQQVSQDVSAACVSLAFGGRYDFV